MQNKLGCLIVVSGPSGAGKGTILKEAFLKNSNLYLSISATTRKPRPGEVDGKDYHFLTRAAFEKLIKSNGLLEYAEYCGNYYGTPADMVSTEINSGHDVVLEIDVQGALQIKKKIPSSLMIFIAPPSLEVLKKRLEQRNSENEQAITKRLEIAVTELSFADQYDAIIYNERLDKAVEDFLSVIHSNKCK